MNRHFQERLPPAAILTATTEGYSRMTDRLSEIFLVTLLERLCLSWSSICLAARRVSKARG